MQAAEPFGRRRDAATRLKRTTYFRRLNSIKKAVEEAGRLNAGRKKKGMKPLCPLLVHVR